MMTLHRPDWQVRAACRGMDPDLFFPVGETVDQSEIAVAREVCASCPVRDDCLEYALTAVEPVIEEGIWAATTPSERRRLRSARRRAS